MTTFKTIGQLTQASDSQVAGYVTDPSSATGTALSNTFGTEISTAGTPANSAVSTAVETVGGQNFVATGVPQAIADGGRQARLNVGALDEAVLFPKDPRPAAFTMAPVAVSGGFVFQPKFGDVYWTQDGEAHSTAPTSDFSLMVGSTWYENIVYSTVTPDGEDGWTATATVASTPAVTVQTTVKRLDHGVWRKRIVLTAASATTAMIYQGYNCPNSGSVTWRHLGLDNGTLSTPSTTTQYPMVGVAAPPATIGTTAAINAAAATGATAFAVPAQAFCLMPDTGVEGWWGINPASGGFIYGTGARLGLYAGMGFSNAAAMNLAAGVPTTIGYTHYSAVFPGSYNPSTTSWIGTTLEPLRRRTFQVASLAQGETYPDPFSQMLAGVARSRVAKGSAADTSGAFLTPAPNYPGCYTRDSFWTQLALQDADVSRQLLSRFAGAINSDNRAPTRAVVNTSTGAITFDEYQTDDSNHLVLMWGLWHLATFGEGVLTTTQVNNLAANIITHLDANNYFSGGTNPVNGWMDSFANPSSVIPANAVSAIMTGYSYIALSAAVILGGTVTASYITGTLAAYQSFFQTTGSNSWVRTFLDPTTYTDSRNWVDVSAISPEFWSQWLLGVPMLTDAQVAAHMDMVFKTLAVDMPAGRAFKCIANDDGSYLPATDWNGTFPGGSSAPPGGVYQNGGSWLLHDFLLLGVGKLHNYTNNDLDAMWRDRMTAEVCVNWTAHESISTSNASGVAPIGTCYRQSFSYGWNAAILALRSFAGLKSF